MSDYSSGECYLASMGAAGGGGDGDGDGGAAGGAAGGGTGMAGAIPADESQRARLDANIQAALPSFAERVRDHIQGQ